jgi:hypothetical protein
MKENGEIKKMRKCGKEKNRKTEKQKSSNHMARNHTWISS